MKITFLTVGKTDIKWVSDGLENYAARLKHYVPFSIVEIPELRNVSALSREQIKEREGELILKNLRPSDHAILLDERGQEYRSLEFAHMLEEKMSQQGRISCSSWEGPMAFRRPCMPAPTIRFRFQG